MPTHPTSSSDATAPQQALPTTTLGPSLPLGLFATAVYVAVGLWTYLSYGA